MKLLELFENSSFDADDWDEYRSHGLHILSQHHRIGIDLDETLIEAGAHSGRLWQFIKSNPEKEFWIVTLRSHGHELSIESDIFKHAYRITLDDFEGVFSMPSKLYEYHIDHDQWYYHGKKPKYNPHMNFRDLQLWDRKYKEWKGKVCHDNGITVLVDDREDLRFGCEKYGVTFINVDDI